MEKQTLVENLGIKFLETGQGRVVATMPVDGRTIQPFGYLHGGASVALAETVASFGAARLIDLEKEICFGLEINANHIRAKQSGQVIATAEILHHGKSTMVWDVKIRDEEEKLICVSRCTIAIMPKK
ncbi:PaaI family thioesterase [Lederbergia ruris]|uniref:Esterase n=1 Tax=Lederbergia ruris TaxID=217495 RepID=A0ABQ4KMS1_9BACI|nr:hotdog fold thioesterase [Lederbergia ruris]GIN59223.1 esterase [Lederbergia ruris]